MIPNLCGNGQTSWIYGKPFHFRKNKWSAYLLKIFSFFYVLFPFLFDKTATGVRVKKWSSKIKSFLTYFSPRFHYYTPRKRSENFGFLTFSGGIEMDHWAKMG